MTITLKHEEYDRYLNGKRTLQLRKKLYIGDEIDLFDEHSSNNIRTKVIEIKKRGFKWQYTLEVCSIFSVG